MNIERIQKLCSVLLLEHLIQHQKIPTPPRYKNHTFDLNHWGHCEIMTDRGTVLLTEERDLEVIQPDDEFLGCKTAGCACGSYVYAYPGEGLFLTYNDLNYMPGENVPVVPFVVYEVRRTLPVQSTDFSAAADFFEITYDEARLLFSPEKYMFAPVSPRDVLQRLTAILPLRTYQRQIDLFGGHWAELYERETGEKYPRHGIDW